MIYHPEAACWGHTFRSLFPLSREVCSGCPADYDGETYNDSDFQLRKAPSFAFRASELNRYFEREIGSYEDLFVDTEGKLANTEAWTQLLDALDKYGVRTLVAPECVDVVRNFRGLVLSKEEFYLCAEKLPYLFEKHVACVFGSDLSVNTLLMKKLKNLDRFGVHRVLISGKYYPAVEGYSISLDRL